MAVSAFTKPPHDTSGQSTLSKIISKLRSKKHARNKSKTPPPPAAQPSLPLLIPSPLPLVLPHHQPTLSTLGWTTLTIPPSTSTLPPHPLHASTIALFTAAQTFFALPAAQKSRWKTRLGTEEGWTSIPGEKEFITLRTLAYCPDVLRDPAQRYWALVGAQMERVLGRVSASLGLPDAPDAGLRKFVGECAAMPVEESGKTATMIRIFRYEGWEAKVVAEPHADLGLVSCVVGDVPGLEVWGENGWVDIEWGYAGNQASVLVGRQLERLSNYRYPAGGHRVVSYGVPGRAAGSGEGEEAKKRYRHSIVFVMRAHEPVVVESQELETEITGRWEEAVSGVTAGEMYEKIRSRHFNINIGHEEREKQRRKVREGKAKESGEGATAAG